MEVRTKKLLNWRALFYSFLILTLAIACAKFIFDGNLSYILLVCVVLFAIVIYCLLRRKIVYFLLLLAVFGIGIGWYFLGMATCASKTYYEQCQVVARVSDNIDYLDYGNACNVVLKDVKINGKKAKNIYARINFQEVDDFKIGDVISFSGEVSNVKMFELGQFQSYYYRNNIGYKSEISTSQISILKNKLTVDEKIRLKVKSNFSGMKNGAIAYAVLFGDKSEVADSVKLTFKSSGVVHLLTVSGLHISFLIALLSFVLKKCRVRGWLNLAVCAVFVVLYAFLCGFTPSILRAGIMGLVLSLASTFGKRYDSLNSLGLAGIIILLVRPMFALDIGFLMSFFCVFSIFALFPLFSKLFSKFLPKKVADGFAVSLAAQVGIFPFALQLGGITNFLSVFANLFIVPIFSVVYPLLFVFTLITLVMPFMAFLLKMCDFGFVVVCKLAEFFSGTAFSTEFKPLNIFAVAFGFLLVLGLSRFFLASTKKKILTCCVLLCLSSVSVVMADFGRKNETSISVCYNYSNSVILLTNKSNESVIIDAGYESFSKRLIEKQKVDKVSAVFVLQNSKVKIDTVRELSIPSIIRTGNGESYEEESLVSLDEAGRVGDFVFRYRSVQGKMVGLEISFDGLKIFVTRDRYTAAENFEEIGKEEFDLVVVGKNSKYAKSFTKTDKVVGFQDEKGLFSSFQRNGNMKFTLKNKQIVGRCLD